MGAPLRIVKRLAVGCCRRTGIETVVSNSRWRRDRLLILAYHGISQDDEHDWNGSLYMSPSLLEVRLRSLRASRCTLLPLSEAIQRLYAGTLPDRSVAVTFDDGYYDFVTRAYPLLEAYGVPATVYLPTLRLGRAVPVFPLVVSYLFWKSKQTRVALPAIRQEPFEVGTVAARKAAVAEIMRISRRERMSPRDRDTVAQALADSIGVSYGEFLERRLFQLMAAEDVTRLAADGVDFQLHTHTHNTPREPQAFAEEIETNRQHIVELTGRVPEHFCYPSGNYDPLFLPWLRALGVRSATTCDPGLATRTTDPLMLSRFVDTGFTSSAEFAGWLSGVTALVSRRKSYAKKLA